MTRFLIRIGALVLLLVVGAAAWWFFRAGADAQPVAATQQQQRQGGQPPANGPGRPDTPVPVLLGDVTAVPDNVQLQLNGSAAAARSVTLYPAAAGEVAEVGFRPGQSVRAGQVLLRLVDRPQQLAVEAAAARVEQARRLLARYESTRGTGAVPGSVIDEAQATLQLARVEEKQAREALADRTLRAPFAGVVGLARVEPGDRVAIDTPITTLDDRRTLLVAFEVPEAWTARVRQEHPVRVSNPAFPGRQFEGRIVQVDSRVDDSTRNLRMRAAVPNPQDELRPGMSFSVELVLPGTEVPAVPELALQWDREGSHVWRVQDGRAQRVGVRPVRRTQGRVLVEGSLQPGQSVVVEGVQRLRPGRAVEVIEREGSARATRPTPMAGPAPAAAAREAR